MCKIGIGVNTPSKKLDIHGFNKFETIMIRIVVWICNKRNIFVQFDRKVDIEEPNNPGNSLDVQGSYSITYTNGNIGITCVLFKGS